MMSKESTKNNRITTLVATLLTTASISEAAEKTGFSRGWIYKIMKTDEFKEKMQEARQEALDSAINYLQGNLSECSQVLMDIVRDEEISPQIRINAINSIFQNIKGLNKENSYAMAGMAVKIIDSI